MSLANVHANANIMLVEHGTGTLLGGIMGMLTFSILWFGNFLRDQKT